MSNEGYGIKLDSVVLIGALGLGAYALWKSGVFKTTNAIGDTTQAVGGVATSTGEAVSSWIDLLNEKNVEKSLNNIQSDYINYLKTNPVSLFSYIQPKPSASYPPPDTPPQLLITPTPIPSTNYNAPNVLPGKTGGIFVKGGIPIPPSNKTPPSSNQSINSGSTFERIYGKGAKVSII